LRRHLWDTRRQSAHDWLFLVATLLLAAASVALPVYGLIVLARHL
jgi:hypothetical protein